MTAHRAAPARPNSAGAPLAADLQAILAGLTAPQKRLSPKYFYDATGSRLFDEICEQPEYYLTRAERWIMERHLGEMAALIGPRVSVIELGSGSSRKIRLLLKHLVDPVAYVPVDISADYLRRMTAELAGDYPDVQIRPVCADFTRAFEPPAYRVDPERHLVFFPGSTIGNFERPEALSLLDVMGRQAGPRGAVLIGVDLKKDPEVLRSAYNDQAGVTAAFNLNAVSYTHLTLPTKRIV